VSSGTIDYYKIMDVDIENSTMIIAAFDSSDVELTITAANDLEDNDYAYRYGTTPNDINPASGISDWNSICEEWAGLESLTADDGRVVNAIAMSGAVKGSRFSAGGNPIDSSHFQSILSLVKRRVGQKKYKWDSAFMHDSTYDALVESRETDRRFLNVTDAKRGVTQLAYQHAKDSVMFEVDEFCPKKRIYVMPTADVLQFYGTDFEYVEPNKGQKFHLLPNSSSDGHKRAVRAYMEGSGCLYSVHSAAIGVIHNFTN
jgi:hypothetical protein